MRKVNEENITSYIAKFAMKCKAIYARKLQWFLMITNKTPSNTGGPTFTGWWFGTYQNMMDTEVLKTTKTLRLFGASFIS